MPPNLVGSPGHICEPLSSEPLSLAGVNEVHSQVHGVDKIWFCDLPQSRGLGEKPLVQAP